MLIPVPDERLGIEHLQNMSTPRIVEILTHVQETMSPQFEEDDLNEFVQLMITHMFTPDGVLTVDQQALYDAAMLGNPVGSNGFLAVNRIAHLQAWLGPVRDALEVIVTFLMQDPLHPGPVPALFEGNIPLAQAGGRVSRQKSLKADLVEIATRLGVSTGRMTKAQLLTGPRF